MRGYTSFPQPVHEDKVRGKPERFADHFTQAALFFNSQSQVEKNHIAAAFRFELTKVQTQAVRERVISMLVNVDLALGELRSLTASASTCRPAQQRALETPADARGHELGGVVAVRVAG